LGRGPRPPRPRALRAAVRRWGGRRGRSCRGELNRHADGGTEDPGARCARADREARAQGRREPL